MWIDRLVAMTAGDDGVEPRAAGLVEHAQIRAAGRREPAIAPLHQHQRMREQVASLLREPILVTRRPLGVLAALEDAMVDEVVQTVREDVGRNLEPALDLVEATQPENAAHSTSGVQRSPRMSVMCTKAELAPR